MLSDAGAPGYTTSDIVYDLVFSSIPFVAPLLAYLLYPSVYEIYQFVGKSAAVELLPAANGVVVPSASIAFGTLIAITIQSLRGRQIALRTLLNNEACAIRSLQTAGAAIFPAGSLERVKLSLLLQQYLRRVVVESRLGIDFAQLERLGASDSELDGLAELFFAAPPAVEPLSPSIRFEQRTAMMAMTHVKDLQGFRSERLSLLQTPFPVVHWIILATLGSSILLAFLFETDDLRQRFAFVDDVSFRYLFTLLVGAFAGLASLCADLADPFRGMFRITTSTEQLESIRDLIAMECSD
jgi:hypothetical protein